VTDYWENKAAAFRADLAHIREKIEAVQQELNQLKKHKELCAQELETCLLAIDELKQKEAG